MFDVLPDRVPWYVVGPGLGLLIVGLFAIAKASKRPMIIQFVMIKPTKTESFSAISGRYAFNTSFTIITNAATTTN